MKLSQIEEKEIRKSSGTTSSTSKNAYSTSQKKGGLTPAHVRFPYPETPQLGTPAQKILDLELGEA